MDIRKIKKLIELVEESGISELEISEGEESVRISRAAPAQAYPVMQQAYAMPAQQQPALAAAVATAPAAETPGGTGGHEWPRRSFANGRHLLPHPKPGRESLRGSGPESERRRYPCASLKP